MGESNRKIFRYTHLFFDIPITDSYRNDGAENSKAQRDGREACDHLSPAQKALTPPDLPLGRFGSASFFWFCLFLMQHRVHEAIVRLLCSSSCPSFPSGWGWAARTWTMASYLNSLLKFSSTQKPSLPLHLQIWKVKCRVSSWNFPQRET